MEDSILTPEIRVQSHDLGSVATAQHGLKPAARVQELAVAAVGSTQFVPDYTWFRRRTYWLRY